MNNKKQPTIYDIAEHLGVSTGTVNRALNNKGRISEETRKRVLAAAEELGYKANRAAQSLRRNPIYIGVLLCCPVQQYLDDIRLGVESAFEELKQLNVFSDIRELGCCNCEDCEEDVLSALDDFAAKGCQGCVLFLSGDGSRFSKKIDDLSSLGMRIATVANDIDGCSRCVCVSADGFSAGQLAAEILCLPCEGGRIAVLAGSRRTAIHRSNIEGFLSYADKNACFGDVKVYEHDDNEVTAKLLIDEMLASELPPDGIYITSAISQYTCKYIDSLALEHRPRIVMTDLFSENRRLLSSHAACATIYQNPYKQGRQVVLRLYEHMIENRTDIEKIALIPQAVFASNMNLYEPMSK